MKESYINIKVTLDQDKVPHDIQWSATDSTAQDTQHAKAMLLAFWDDNEKSALRIDLWNKDMTMDEMADFFYQVLVTMGDTFNRATGKAELVNDLKKFANEFHSKYEELEYGEKKK
ncbi:MAG: gliding motility protein GldC [Chitinophagaceae bacterium]|nr:gliding motility protein GldC [Chitinophagaceae bacterium]